MQVFRILAIPIDDENLLQVVQLASSPAEIIIEALNLMHAQKSELLEMALGAAGRSSEESVQIRRLELVVETDDLSTTAVDEIERAVTQAEMLKLKQRAVLLLGQMKSASADAMLKSLATEHASQLDASPIGVELLEVLEQRADDSPGLAVSLGLLRGSLQSAGEESVEGEFAVCLTGGDSAKGRQLFNTHLQAQCVRCHRIGKQGSTVGPKLDEVASKRKPDYLLRSIVAPSADIDEKYRAVTVVLASGKTVQGLKVKETDDVLVLADNRGQQIEVNRDDIDDVFAQKISIMPEMTKALTLREIRDILAYLLTLKAEK